MPRFVVAVNTVNNKKQRVPEHWLGHPTLGKNLKLAPSKREETGGTLTATAPESVKGKAATNKNEKETGNAEDNR